MSTPLFRRLLGTRFDTLPPQLRALHAIDTQATWRGEASILRGTNPLARLCAAMTGLPPSRHAVPTTIVFSIHDDAETWARDFGGARLRSRCTARDGFLHERLGPMTFRFALDARDDEIHWRTAGVRLLGVLPLPARWFADVRCREREHAGRYEFLVEAAMPVIGRLIRYEGWLVPA
ncbi:MULTISPECIES: DUF4166 domain-containing protein [Lysobacteraceae]|uniref:DUF4166 domain-containing protein n=1 Tax=Lysobacteraceae TaxID=32033 RepID=UPI001FD2047F|nr:MULTISPECIES: DUF4166 domain-containing protein [Lysobacter]